jgi:hypothetical protein
MKLNASGVVLGLALIALGSALPGPARAEAVDGVAGSWEGPWYRGMTSGKVRITIEGEGGTIQFTNLDNYGDAPHALTNVSFDGKVLQFRTEGEKGGPLTAGLKLNEAGDQLKGFGKFDGFPLRFEIKRAPQ